MTSLDVRSQLKTASSNRSWMYICIPFFVTLFLIFKTMASEEFDCQQALKFPTKRHELIVTRALAIIEHQNQLREQVGLPIFKEEDYLSNFKKKPPKNITSEHRYIIVKSRLVLILADENWVHLALRVDDVHSLNYVYRFEGTKLVEAIPSTIFYISQMDEVVNLIRMLSWKEAQLWESGNLKALRESPRAISWGYDVPIAHFSVEKAFHSLGPNMATISANVPREVLLRWAQQKLITIGSEGDYKGKPDRFEIVVKSQAWEELVVYLGSSS